MSSIQQEQMPYFYSSSLAVDGERQGLPFSTMPAEVDSWWEVDLGKKRTIDHMIIYHGNRVMPQQFPLLIGISDDGIKYRVVSIIPAAAKKQTAPWKILFQGKQARFLRIQTSGQGSFSLTEVEVYPL